MPAFNFGAVLSRFFRLIGENAALFALLGLVGTVLPTVVLSGALYSALGLARLPWSESFTMSPLYTGLSIAGSGLIVFVLSLLNQSMVTEATILRAVGKPVEVSSLIRHALGNFLPLFAVLILTALLYLLGLALFVIPCFFWMICTCVAVPVRVGEPSLGILGSIQKSFDLTRGHRWWLLLIWFVALLAGGMISSAVNGTVAVATLSSYREDNLANALPAQLVSAATSGVMTVLANIFTAAVYVTLRESKDKLSPETAASVFE
ncbi:MAG TPA: hypothetical protein VG839_02765 [Asticcacaulis sp.]|nr:hypothetical protein [Asticcacaulis sp.]